MGAGREGPAAAAAAAKKNKGGGTVWRSDKALKMLEQHVGARAWLLKVHTTAAQIGGNVQSATRPGTTQTSTCQPKRRSRGNSAHRPGPAFPET